MRPISCWRTPDGSIILTEVSQRGHGVPWATLRVGRYWKYYQIACKVLRQIKCKVTQLRLSNAGSWRVISMLYFPWRCPLRDNRNMQESVTCDPEVMHGAPVFRGTRVPVKTLFDYLESGESLDDFLQGFPTVSRALAIQVLEESKELRLARV